MSERKIRLTLSSTLNNNVGALIDVDFNSENLDVDLDVAAEYGVSALIKEYTIDATAGTYNLDISYKNDVADDIDKDGVMEVDRNLVIEQIEFASNGVDYTPLLISSANTNLEENKNFISSGWIEQPNPDYNPTIPKSRETNHPYVWNPEFNKELPQTDSYDNGYVDFAHPGTNSILLYELVINPVTIYNSSTATFQITFV
jgi:hypothetical protein